MPIDVKELSSAAVDDNQLRDSLPLSVIVSHLMIAEIIEMFLGFISKYLPSENLSYHNRNGRWIDTRREDEEKEKRKGD